MELYDNNMVFGQIKYMNFLNAETIKEFINNYIYKISNVTNIQRELLANLNDIYVLVACYNTQKVPTLSCSQYMLLKKNKYYILGFILLSSQYDEKVDYIDFIDTRLKKNNLAKYMIQRYECMYSQNKYLLPRFIINSSVGYWEKYFTRFDVKTIKDLSNLIDKFNINIKIVKWYELKKKLLSRL